MAEYELNRCYACKKLFCCIECCTNHIRNKHPGRESECPLCRSEVLIVRNFNHSHFLCHVVINHLPLHCRSCGDIFETTADLKAFGTCSQRLLKKKINIVNERGHSVISHTPSPLNKTPLIATPLNKTPLNPVHQRQGYSIEGNYNSNFDSLTSPPEFTRHTSTPMNIGLSRPSTNIVFKTPKSPNFSLKTPKTSICLSEGKNIKEKIVTIDKSIDGSGKSSLQELSSKTESIYLSFPSSIKSSYSEKTPLKSILSNKSIMGEPQSYIKSPSETDGLEIKSVQDVEKTTDDMDLTDPIEHVNHHLKTPVNEHFQTPQDFKDSGKKVRFSDQFDIKTERKSVSPNESSVPDTDEFFEARQSLSEFSLINFSNRFSSSPCVDNLINFSDNKLNISPFENKENQIKIEINDEEIETLNNFKSNVNDENEKIEENKENIINFKNDQQNQEENIEKKTDKEKVSTSSRVVMMVLVEKTVDNAPVDLRPLIDSGLKTLESAGTKIVPNLLPEEYTSQKPSEESLNNPQRLSVVSVDSYTSVSSIEAYKKRGLNSSSDNIQSKKKCEEERTSQSGGLFSAVANAVRTAFKNISEAVSIKPTINESDLAISLSETVDQELSIEPSRSSKRLREEDIISLDEIKVDNDDPSREIRSPEQKRPRAWYRQIRGRDPIARMKSGLLNSSKGISSETQCFQQGSLSVGNTVIPLPSRAHQSTQTDN